MYAQYHVHGTGSGEHVFKDTVAAFLKLVKNINIDFFFFLIFFSAL